MADGNEKLFDDLQDEGDTEESDSERRRRQRLELGIPTETDLLDLLDQVQNQTLEGPSAEDLFRQSVEYGLPPDVGFRRSGERAKEEVAFNKEKGLTVSDLIATILDRAGGGGRQFRPSVLEQPSERELFKTTENAALGPAPEMLFRDVFAGAFPDLTQGRGPYEKFVGKQEGELENRFLGDVFRQFTQPGFIDTLRGDYEKLYRTKERGDFEGTGGSIPAFEDFIKTRISGDYRSFLETEKPKLQQAFELASPEERGQRDQGAIAPPKRIL